MKKTLYSVAEIYAFAEAKNLAVTDCTSSTAIDPEDVESRPEYTLEEEDEDGEPVYGFVYMGTFDEYQKDSSPLFKKVKY